MTAINHALSGTLIGFIVSNPFIALPLAFISHFILDLVPHYGHQGDPNLWLRSKKFKIILFIDIVLCLCLGLVLIYFKPTHYLLALACAIIATSPDLTHLRGFIQVNRNKNYRPNWFDKFSSYIQWFEKPIGSVVEIIFGLAIVVILFKVF